MNKTSIGIGSVMLAAAAVFIYFDDPLFVRIIAAVIFVAGAALLYQSLSRTLTDADAESEGERGTAEDAPARTASPAIPRVPGETAANAVAPGLPEAADVDEPEEIPVELYRCESDALPKEDPRAEFDFLTNKLLQAAKDHVLAHTVGLFWINMDREQIIIGEFVTDSTNFTTARRLSLGSDLVSRVGLDGKPALVSDLSPASESDLAIYYDATEGIKSFIGIPVYFGNDVIAVLAADSRAADAFGLETVAALGRFVSLITLLLGSYNQKFDLAADARMLGVLDGMQRGIEHNQDSYGIAGVAAKAASEIMDWDYVAVVLHHPEQNAWLVVKSLAKAANLPYIAEGVAVQMDGSVLRPALDGDSGIIVDAPVSPAWRFHEKEAINSFGQLCAMPLVTPRAYYGLIVVEYRETHQYASQDLAVLRRIATRAAQALEVVRLAEHTRRHLIIDETTQTASRTLLLARLREEQARLATHGGNAVFFLAALDRPEEITGRHGEAEIDRVLSRIGTTLREHVRPFDVVGRFDRHAFGLLLMHSSPEDAYLRGEKVRKAVAGNVITHAGSSYSISVSIAGCTVGQTSDVEHILRLSQQALERAVADGGNCVKVV
ncbi:MAG: diguanylate cyclase [Bacteroidota bacterium]|nr:diguanylate cyclase [Bacteroidota bacterium]